MNIICRGGHLMIMSICVCGSDSHGIYSINDKFLMDNLKVFIL